MKFKLNVVRSLTWISSRFSIGHARGSPRVVFPPENPEMTSPTKLQSFRTFTRKVLALALPWPPSS